MKPQFKVIKKNAYYMNVMNLRQSIIESKEVHKSLTNYIIIIE